MPIYKLDNDTYNIPDDVVEQFEKDNPGALIQYSADGDDYDIPVSEKAGFLEEFPEAQYRGAETAQPQQQDAQQAAADQMPVVTDTQPQENVVVDKGLVDAAKLGATINNPAPDTVPGTDAWRARTVNIPGENPYNGRTYGDVYDSIISDFGKNVNHPDIDPYAEARAQIMQAGITDDLKPEEAERLALNIREGYANRFAENKAKQMVSSLPDQVQNIDQLIDGLWYNRDVQAKVAHEAQRLGLRQESYVNSFVKPQLAKALSDRYGYDADSARHIASRLLSQEQHVTERIRQNEAVDLIGKYVAPQIQQYFDDAMRTAEDQFRRETENVGTTTPTGLPNGQILGSFSRAWQNTDPAKIWEQMKPNIDQMAQSITNNPEFFAEAMQHAEEEGIEATQWIEKRVMPMLQSQLQSQFEQMAIEREMPKNTMEYLWANIQQSLVGTIARAALESQARSRMKAEALQRTESGQGVYNPSFGARIGGGALSMLPDMALPFGGPFGITAKAATAPVRGMGQALIADGIRPVIARMAESSASGMLSLGAFEGLKGGVEGAVNPEGQESFLEDNRSAGEVLADIVKGSFTKGVPSAFTGATMVGGPVGQKIANGRGALANALGWGAQVGIDAAGATALNAAINMPKIVTGDVTLQDVGNEFASNLGTFAALGLHSKGKEFASLAKGGRSYNGVNFTKEEMEMLENRYLQGIRQQIGEMEKSVKNLGHIERAKYGSSIEAGKQEAIKTAGTMMYNDLMRSYAVPQELKVKVSQALGVPIPEYALKPSVLGLLDDVRNKTAEVGLIDAMNFDYNKPGGVADKARAGEPLSNYELTLRILFQDNVAYNEALKKQQAGEPLTEQEQELVDVNNNRLAQLEREYRNQETERIIDIFERENDMKPGTLKKMLGDVRAGKAVDSNLLNQFEDMLSRYNNDLETLRNAQQQAAEAQSAEAQAVEAPVEEEAPKVNRVATEEAPVEGPVAEEAPVAQEQQTQPNVNRQTGTVMEVQLVDGRKAYVVDGDPRNEEGLISLVDEQGNPVKITDNNGYTHDRISPAIIQMDEKGEPIINETKPEPEKEPATPQGGLNVTADKTPDNAAVEDNGQQSPALSRIPVNEKGEQVWESATAEDAAAALVERQGSIDEAREDVGDLIGALEAQLKELTKSGKDKGRQPTNMNEIHKKKDAIRDARKKLDFWNNVKDILENGTKTDTGQKVDNKHTDRPAAVEGEGGEAEVRQAGAEEGTGENPSVISQPGAEDGAGGAPVSDNNVPGGTSPVEPTAEQKIAQGTVKNNIGKRFAFRNPDGKLSEVVINSFKGDDMVEVTRQDFDSDYKPINEPYTQDLNLVDIGNSIVNGQMKPVKSVEERLRDAFKGRVGMQNVIDVLTEEERAKMLDAVEKGDEDAVRDMTNEFLDSHREDLILNERDKRNSNVSRIMEGNGSREDKLRRVRKEFQGYDEAEVALSDESLYPASAEEWVSELNSRIPKSGEGPLAYFSYNVDGREVVSMQGETGFGSKNVGDNDGFKPWLAPKGKGMSLLKYAEQLHSQLPEELQEKYSVQDMRNAVRNVFGSAERPSDITTMVIRRGVLQAEQAARRMEEQWIDSGASFQKVSRDDNSFTGRLERAKQQTNTEPSEDQKKAGNYKKGHVSFGGYDFVVENPEGSFRRGESDGKKWEQKMNNTYGYILGKRGKDGDHLDMFINDAQDLDNWNGKVYVVDQVNPKTGEFDEHKIMYGFDSEAEARDAYLSNYEEGWQGLGKITGVDKDTFDKWLDSSDKKIKEFSDHSIIKDAVEKQPEKHAPTEAEIDKAIMYEVFKEPAKQGVKFNTDVEKGQRVLDEANGNASLSRGKKRALETASLPSEEDQPTVVSSADGAKVLKNLDTLAKDFENLSNQPKFFIGNLAEKLGAKKDGSKSEYATFETKNGRIVTIRLADHNATVSDFDHRNENDGISIVITAKDNDKIINDGDAHIVEFFYDAIKLRRATGKPLVEIIRSIQQSLYSGEYKDTTGLAEREEVNAKEIKQYKASLEDAKVTDETVRPQKVSDKQTLEDLEKGPTVKRYRAMQLIDGKLYPPMSAKVDGEMRQPTEIGVWEQAEERPDLIKNGKFVLNKGQKGQGNVPAAYNPYFHTSTSGLNDQFTSAYKRPELVVVEVEIPESELTSGYKAEGAKDAVGNVDWHSGVVNGQLPADRQRQVTLSRYSKVNRIVPDSEVADMIVKQLEGTNVEVPYNVVTPQLRKALEERGVKISDKPAGSVTEDINGNPIRQQKVYHGSGSEFDEFDHSHMGEGQGSQSFGWGTYVTKSSDIGTKYAHMNYERTPEHRAIRQKWLDAAKEYGHISSMIEEAYMKGESPETIETLKKTRKVLRDRYNQARDEWEESRKKGYLYDVEIPDENEAYYIDYQGKMGDQKDILDMVDNALTADGWKRQEIDSRIKFTKGDKQIILTPNQSGADLYAELSDALGGDKQASEFLHDTGVTGIKYPAGTIMGGGDGATNYVIFNENDAKITDRTKFFKTSDGHAYGYTYKGEIYIDPRIATSETPIHEYGHLWAEMKRQTSPEEWSRIKEVLLKDKLVEPFIEKVKRDYPELEGREDDFVEEVLTQFSGKHGAEKLRKMAQEIKEELGGDATAETIAEAAVRRVKSILNDFWKGICDMMGWQYTNAEDIADSILRDMLNGVNPQEQIKEASKQLKPQQEIERTLMGVHNLSEEKLRKVLKQGGLANPSMAVIDTKNHMHSDYGDISLIPKADLIDARKGRNAGTFTADAWTPSYPKVDLVMSNKGIDKHFKDLGELKKAVGSEIGSQIRMAFDSYLDGREPDGMYWWYLHERGLKPEVVKFGSEYDKKTTDRINELTDNGNLAMSEMSDEAIREVADLYSEHMKRKGEELMPVEERIKKLEEGAKNSPNDKVRMKREEWVEQVKRWGNTRSTLDNFAAGVMGSARRNGTADHYATFLNARKRVEEEKLKGDYQKWLDELHQRYGVEEKIFDGYTPSGNRKYIPNTLENVSKYMKKQGLNGATNWSSVGNWIAKVANKETTLQGIRKNKKNLNTTQEEHDAFREKWGNVLFPISERLGNGDIFNGENIMSDILEHKDFAGYYKREYGRELTKDEIDTINTFIKEVQTNFPTGYFETKFERPVYLNEFEIAVVPENTSPDIIEALKNAGLDVRTYDTSDYDTKEEKRRQAAMDAVSGRDDILFQKKTDDNERAKIINLNDRIVKMPEKQIEDLYTEGLKPEEAIHMQDRVLDMSPKELIEQYRRLNSQMLDENGLNVDEQEDAFRQKWAEEHGWPPAQGSGFGQATADHFQEQVNKYTYNKMALRWDILDRIKELGLEDYIDKDTDELPEVKTAEFIRMQKAPGSPEPELTPEERQYWNKWDADMRKWKERNGLAADAQEPGEKPVKRPDEDMIDFVLRHTKYNEDKALWKTAPRLEDYRQQRSDKDALEAARDNVLRYPFSQSAKMRLAAAEFQQIRSAMGRQKAYDKATVKAVTDFAQEYMRLGFGDHLTRGDIERLLSSVKNATGAKDIRKYVDNIMNILTDNYLRNLDQQVQKLSSTKELSKTAQGVEKQGKLELKGQKMIQAFRKAREERMTADEIRERMAEVAEYMARNPEGEEMWEHEYEGLSLALQYAEDIEGSRKEYIDLDHEYSDALKTYQISGRTYQQQQEYLESLDRARMENKLERIGMFGDLIGRLQGNISESIEGAKEFVEREKERVRRIHRLAERDMSGRSADAEHENTWKMRLNNSAVPRMFLGPLATFEQMLKQFGGKNPNGEGWLYNHYMRGYIDAVDREQAGREEALKELDNKVSEVFGKKMRWSDLYGIERKKKDFPDIKVKWLTAEGEEKEHTLSQGNALYIYMVNKMNDGAMKLRQMGITEEEVQSIKELLDPRFVELADWLQGDFLVRQRVKYNDVYQRVFGAPMAAIENYFPLRILGDALTRDVDVTADPNRDDVMPSTVTGSIIKRKHNKYPLDILNTDAFSLAIEHIEDMEKWSAFVEWYKDINSLLSYSRFKNQVKNMNTVYGGGDKLWDNFRHAAQLASGTYRPTKAEADKFITTLASGVTGAKIAFRPYTALKQLLSAPAFIPDVDIKEWFKCFHNNKNFWHDNIKWAMENMPVMRKRWTSRDIGDTRLSDNSGWGYWDKNVRGWISKWGIGMNALVDRATCSAGARAIYRSKYKRYINQGFSEEDANRRALQDAEIGYNLTQQSSEGAFVSTVQKDRTMWANMWSVFRNSSMAYTRQAATAVRNLEHWFKYKDEAVDFLKEQFEAEGLSEEDARSAAEADYKRALWRNGARLAVSAWVLPLLWDLGSKVPYLIWGDDDEEKEKMVADALRKELVVGPAEGLMYGQAMNGLWGAASSRDVWDTFKDEGLKEGMKEGFKALDKQNVNPMPLFSDMGRLMMTFSKDEAAGFQDLVNLAAQMATGVNPQTLTDPITAIIDYSGGDMGAANEIALLLMRLMMVPSESSKNVYIDELGMNAEDAKKLSFDEAAERYSKYMMQKNAPFFQWTYSDEAEKKRRDSYIERFTKDVQKRVANLEEKELEKNFGATNALSERDLLSKEEANRKDSKDALAEKTDNMKYETKKAVDVYAKHRTWQDLVDDLELIKAQRDLNAIQKHLDELIDEEKEKRVELDRYQTEDEDGSKRKEAEETNKALRKAVEDFEDLHKDELKLLKDVNKALEKIKDERNKLTGVDKVDDTWQKLRQRRDEILQRVRSAQKTDQ